MEKHQWQVKCILVSTATTEGAQEETCRGVEPPFCYQTNHRSPTDDVFSRSGANHVVPPASLSCVGTCASVSTWREALLWFSVEQQRVGDSSNLGPRGVVSAGCVCVCACVLVQQFDRSDKGTVVGYTLVLTCCSDHILSAYSPLCTPTPDTCTLQAPASKPPTASCVYL